MGEKYVVGGQVTSTPIQSGRYGYGAELLR